MLNNKCVRPSLCLPLLRWVSGFNGLVSSSSGVSGEKLEIDPVTSQKATTKFWIRQKPISIDSDHLCACDLVEERSPSESSQTSQTSQTRPARLDQPD